MFSWFIHTVGFWGMLTLAAAMGIFLGSCIAVVRSPNVLSIRSCCIVLSMPLLVGLVASVVNGLSTFESIRKIADDLELTRFDIATAVIQSMWMPLFDAVVLTAPTVLVLVVGRLIRARSIVKKIEPH